MDLVKGRPRQRVGPTRYYGAEPSGDGTIVRLSDGRTFLDADVIMDDDSIEQIRQGYKCIRCHEPQSEPFPVICETRLPEEVGGALCCLFPIREKQQEEFAIMFKGTVHVGSRVDLADELARMAEHDEYEARTGLVLPDHVKFPNETRPS